MRKNQNKVTQRLRTPKETAGEKRWLLATVLVAIGTTAIIAIAVWLTPLEPIDPEQGIESSSNPAENGTLGAAGVPATLNLPETPVAVTVSQLQEELTTLAEQVQQRYPSDPASYHFAAQIFAELKQAAKAEGLWQKCIAVQPNHIGAHIGLADLMISAGRDNEAIATLKQVQDKIGVTAELLLKLGEATENLGELEQSKIYFQQAVEKFPAVAQGWLALGRVQNQLGEFAAAEENLRKVVAMGLSTEASLFALSTALARQKKDVAAEAVRASLQELQKQDREQRQFQDAYESTLRAIASKMLDSVAFLEEQHGQLPTASKYAQRAIALTPTFLQSYMTLSAIERKLGNSSNVIAIHERLLKLQPENILNYMNLASVVLQTGDTRKAEATLKAAIQFDPQGTLAQSALAQFYLAVGNLADAKALANQVAERKPAPEAFELLSAVCKASGDTSAADEFRLRAQAMRTEAANAKPK
jgi:tetratricopeptide (TPR) repeat protein